ncbi:MAG: zinc-ribbon domain-containing protein [Pseudonocardiaceae bacterium]
MPAGSRMSVGWVCRNDGTHRWQAPPNNRVKNGSGCPFCATSYGNKVHASQSLEAICPNIAREWHPSRNEGLLPSQVLPTSTRDIWWRCEVGHEWHEQVRTRTRLRERAAKYARSDRSAPCPGCSTLALQRPDLAAQWHPTRNGDLGPEDVPAGTERKVWWQCAEGHEWQAQLYDRVAGGRGCPFCAKGSSAVAHGQSLADLHPDVAERWHPSRNGELRPDHVRAGSSRKVWWKCSSGPDHEWEATSASLTTQGRRSSTRGCPYCAGPGFRS